VNVQELLRWLGERLNLEWVTEDNMPAQNAASEATQPMVLPAKEQLNELLSLVNLGYMRGINEKLEALLEMDPAYQLFVETLKDMARQFQLEAMKNYLEEKLTDV
jgi:hypothetical protein